MTIQDMKDELLTIRITQQRYRLAADKAAQFDEMQCCPPLARAYHKRAENLEKEMLAARKRAERYIALLDMQSEKEVITRRYIMLQSWEQIAEVMNYSMRQVFRVHTKALKKMSLNVTKDE